MCGQIVHDHDIAAPQAVDKHLLDIGDASHRPVEHHRCRHTLEPQRSGEGGDFPVPVGDG